MVRNTPLIVKIFIYISIEKSAFGSEFTACNDVIKNILRTREVSHSIGYKVNEPFRILYNNKGVILLACRINIIINKV